MTTDAAHQRIAQTVAAISPPSAAAREAAAARQATLTKPPGSLGRLEELAIWLAGVQGRARPVIRQPALILAAADHGVARHGVSAYPQAVTGQMMANFRAGRAAVNVLARAAGVRVTVVDAGVVAASTDSTENGAGAANVPVIEDSGAVDQGEASDHSVTGEGARTPPITEPITGAKLPAPVAAGDTVNRFLRRWHGPGTADFTSGPAMSRAVAQACLQDGINLARAAIAEGADLLLVGEMGIGNTTSAAAITAAVSGLPVAAVTGRGTGVSDEGLARKVAAIEAALVMHRPDPRDGVGLLAAVGGFEIGVLAGVILGAAAERVPVLLDGFITAAAALIAAALAPEAAAYLLAAHRSVELGHLAALGQLGLSPLLELELRLGEGTGALLALPLLTAAARLLDEMATFAEAGVAGAGAPPSGRE